VWRELKRPKWAVERKQGAVVIRFGVPGSKFGGVHVWLSHEEADALGTRLIVEAEEEEAL
jgi:hypothetical protein